MSGRSFSLPAEIPPTQLLNPAADSGGRTSAYVTLKNAIKAYIVVHITQGAANTVALTPLQAQNVAGLNSKAINAVPIFTNLDTSLTSALTQQTAAANYTTDAGTKNKIVIFEILPEAALDLANGFTTIAIQTGASSASNITFAVVETLAQVKALGASQPNILVN
jgi:hypothetical protein